VVNAQEMLRITGWDPKTLTTYVNKGFFRHFLRQNGERYTMLKNGSELSQAEFAEAGTQVKDDQPTGASRMKPCPALAKVIGPQPVSRVDLPKRVWVYLRSKGLQTAQASTTIQCDEVLRALCGKGTISTFELMKVLSEHLVAAN